MEKRWYLPRCWIKFLHQVGTSRHFHIWCTDTHTSKVISSLILGAGSQAGTWTMTCYNILLFKTVFNGAVWRCVCTRQAHCVFLCVGSPARWMGGHVRQWLNETYPRKSVERVRPTTWPPRFFSPCGASNRFRVMASPYGVRDHTHWTHHTR